MNPTPEQAIDLITKLVSRPSTAVNGMVEAENIALALKALREAVLPPPSIPVTETPSNPQ